MSLSYEVTVHCDCCFVWEQTSRLTAMQFRRVLHKRGWKTRKSKLLWVVDYCPQCVTREAEALDARG